MSLAKQLREQTAAVKLTRSTFGIRKRLNTAERARAAEPFAAAAEFLSASKKLIDTKEASYRAVTGTISRARAFWKSMTVFYPVRGVRLIRKDMIELFETRMTQYQTELNGHLDQLCEQYGEVKNRAREKLGDLYRSGDYPLVGDLRDEFSIGWEYPSVEPPNFLKELNPKLYEEQQALVAARFDEALAVAEQAMTVELQGLIDGLCDKLAPSSGGKKTLNASAINGLNEFVGKFRALNCRSGSDLEALVEQAEALTKGVDPKELKKSTDQQGQLFNAMTAVKESLDKLVVDAPNRKITLED